MSTQFDLEQKILHAWGMSDTLRTAVRLANKSYERTPTLAYEELSENVMCLAQVLDLLMEDAFQEFEKLVKERAAEKFQACTRSCSDVK